MPLVFVLLLIPMVSASTITTTKNCTNDFLVTNVTGVLLNDYSEIVYQNVSCGSDGCAYNEMMCNHPENLESSTVISISVLLIVVGLVFLYLSSQIIVAKGVTTQLLRYLLFFISFIFLIQAVIFMMGTNTLTPNALDDAVTVDYIIFLIAISFITMVTILTEGQAWAEKLMKKGQRI